MKKRVFSSVLLWCSCLGLIFAGSDFRKKCIIKTEPSEIREVWPSFQYFKDKKSEVTYSQMQEDLDYFKFLMKNVYAGCEHAESKGMDLDKVVSNIEAKYAGKETVYAHDITYDLWEEIKPYISDQHFSIIYFNGGTSADKSLVYYTDIFLKDSEVESFKNANPDLVVVPYCSEGKIKNRVAVISEKPLAQIEVNGKAVKVENYPTMAASSIPRLTERVTQSTVYIHLESFMSDNSKGQYLTFEKFCKTGERYLDKANIILDLRSNTGGNPQYVESFLAGLVFDYRKAADNKELIEKMENSFRKKIGEIMEGSFKKESYILSKALYENGKAVFEKRKANKLKISAEDKKLLKEYKRLCKYYLKNPEITWLDASQFDASCPCLKKFPEQPAFKGRLIILQNRHSASASEEMVHYAKKIFDEKSVIVVGENSWGAMEYFGNEPYLFPNLKMGLYMGSQSNKPALDRLSSWHGEGKGIYPDIWTTDDDMLETLVLVTKDEALRYALEGLQ